MRIEERIWRTPQQSYLRVLPGCLGVSARGKSRRLQRVLSDFGAEHSFAQGCARLQEHYGFSLNASAGRTVTLIHAQRAAQTLAAEYEGSFRQLPAQGAPTVVAEADGTMICTVEPGQPRHGPRPRQWQEMRLLAAQAQGSTETSYAATFDDVDAAGQRWGHCTRDAGWGLNSRIHIVADGAEWIARQSRDVFGGQATLLTDFYHVSEYLAAASGTCRPSSPDSWLRTQQKRLKRGALPLLFEELEPHLEPPAQPEESAPVRAAYRYLDNRRDALDYADALARELPIGSGMIESGHKHVLQARLKKAGTTWLHSNADAIAQLRILRANHRWDHFWTASTTIQVLHHN